MTDPSPLSIGELYEEIEGAAARIAPVRASYGVDAIGALQRARGAGAEVFLKHENLQETGSFKVRGALNTLLSLPEESAGGVSWPPRPGTTARLSLTQRPSRARGRRSSCPRTPPRRSWRRSSAAARRSAESGDPIRAERTGEAEAAGRTYVSPYNDRRVHRGTGDGGSRDRRRGAGARRADSADADATVRAVACASLADQPKSSPRAAEALVTRLADDEWTVVVEAAKGLGRHHDATAVDPLLALLREARSLHVRAAAAGALGEYGEREEIAPTLRAALDDPSTTVRSSALGSLVAVAPPDVGLAALERFAASDSRFLRARAAELAGGVLAEGGYKVTAALLEDPEPAVRAAAVESLPRFQSRGDTFGETLRDALEVDDVAVRDAAARSVLELGHDELADDLIAALDDSEGPDFTEARVSLVKAIAKLADDAMPALLGRLDDDERVVREAAREEIARLGGAIPKLPARTPRPPPVDVDVAGELLRDDYPQVELVTAKGRIVLELLTDVAPVHASLFLARVRDGFYDGLPFHRLVPGFVLQGLDPRGDGWGTGGHTLRAEVNPLRYARGSVGMPDAGLDTGGCQLFITFRPQPRLDARYTQFARVYSGMRVVEELDVDDRVERAFVVGE